MMLFVNRIEGHTWKANEYSVKTFPLLLTCESLMPGNKYEFLFAVIFSFSMSSGNNIYNIHIALYDIRNFCCRP